MSLGRLTLLAPDMVEAILDGRQAEVIALPRLMDGVSIERRRQFHRPDLALQDVLHD